MMDKVKVGDKAIVIINNGNDVTINQKFPSYVTELGKELVPKFGDMDSHIKNRAERIVRMKKR